MVTRAEDCSVVVEAKELAGVLYLNLLDEELLRNNVLPMWTKDCSKSLHFVVIGDIHRDLLALSVPRRLLGHLLGAGEVVGPTHVLHLDLAVPNPR